MRHEVDMIDRLADLVLDAGDPPGLAERTLEVVMSLNDARGGAVFAADGARLTLFASRGIDQAVLDAVHTVWSHHRDLLQSGETVYVADRRSDPRLPPAVGGQAPTSLAVVPVFSGESLVGLVYLDSARPAFCDPQDLARLAKFSRIFAKAVTDAGRPTAVSETPGRAPARVTAETDRDRLLGLLNQNEWNIARVARILGVTRVTVYMRLKKYAIPRERVIRTPPRASQAQEIPSPR